MDISLITDTKYWVEQQLFFQVEEQRLKALTFQLLLETREIRKKLVSVKKRTEEIKIETKKYLEDSEIKVQNVNVQIITPDLPLPFVRKPFDLDSVYVWLSNLQKMIRRSKEKEAIASAYVLHQGIGFNYRKRLCTTILSEDLSLTCNSILPLAKDILKLGPDEWFQRSIELISYACNFPKTRLSDLLVYIDSKPEVQMDDCFNIERKIEDVTIFSKKFTEPKVPGRQLLDLISKLRSLAYYCKYHHNLSGSKMIDLRSHGLEFHKRPLVFEFWKYLLDKSMCTPFYSETLILANFYLASKSILNLIHAALNIFYYYHRGLANLPVLTLDECDFDITNVEPDDVAYDKHTKKGRMMGRGLKHFYTEGCLIDPMFNLSSAEEMYFLEEIRSKIK